MNYKRKDWIPSNKSILGTILRLPLRLIPKDTIVPILSTAARGKKWIADSGAHSQWLGIHEINKKKFFQRTIQPGSVVYDIGANVGIYTLLSSVLCGDTGKVFAFEPDPHNIEYLWKHVQLNQLNNISIIEYAISNKSGNLSFESTSDHCTSHLSDNGKLKVKAITLDQFVSDNTNSPPDYIKIDVEGAENLVLEGGHKTLRQHKPKIFLATHGYEIDQICRQQLKDLGYNISKIRGYDDELYCVPK
jgi:FkbM family methyltransferase